MTSDADMPAPDPHRAKFAKAARAISYPVGILIACILVALKLLVLATEQGWALYLPPDPIANNLSQISKAHWPAISVILFEGFVAGSAVTITFRYGVSIVSNIWATIQPLTPSGLMFVEERTRKWVDDLTMEKIDAAEKTIIEQREEIQSLNVQKGDLKRQLSDLDELNRVLQERLRKDQELFARFADSASGIGGFADDIKRKADEIRRDRDSHASL